MIMRLYQWRRHSHHSRAWWWEQCHRWVFSKSKTFASNMRREKTTELKLEQVGITIRLKTTTRAWTYQAYKTIFLMLENSQRTYPKLLVLRISITDPMLTLSTEILRWPTRGLLLQLEKFHLILWKSNTLSIFQSNSLASPILYSSIKRGKRTLKKHLVLSTIADSLLYASADSQAAYVMRTQRRTFLVISKTSFMKWTSIP